MLEFRNISFSFPGRRNEVEVLRDVSFSCKADEIVAVIGPSGCGKSTLLSLANGLLLRPLPYRNADRLVVALHGGTDPVAPANYIDWRYTNSLVGHIVVERPWWWPLSSPVVSWSSLDSRAGARLWCSPNP